VVLPETDSDRIIIRDAFTARLAIIKEAFVRFLDRCRREILQKFEADFPSINAREVAELLRRLEADILPNMIPDNSLLGVPAHLRAILNASAFYRQYVLLQHGLKEGCKETFEDLQKIERLTAKALEVSYIQRDFNKKREGHVSSE